MKLRRVLSVLLAVLIVVSCVSVIGTVAAFGADVDAAASGSAYTDMQTKTTAANKYGLSETVNDGLTLQAWNWSFANIEANLEKVAEQGFTTIQVSPPNEIKLATKNVNVTQGESNGWWMFYQPVGFQLNNSTDNALGVKSEFVSMCNKAHELGLKIIVDAVINHVGTKDGTPDSDQTVMNHVNDKVRNFEPVLYNNQLFHSPWKKMTYVESNASQYDSTYDLTRNCTSGLPDLKTEDSRVQQVIFEYLDELIEAGADGFRFDAAKHIETPDDISSLRSDFWPNTLGKVRQKYPDKEIYAYGEILNTCGVNRPFSMYTKLFDVTDSGSYWAIKNAVTGQYDGNATPFYPNSNFSSSNTVLWNESHDTYVDGATTSLNVVQRGKIWALVAGRNGISSVYLARPSDNTDTGALNSIKLGDVKMTAWFNATTKAINQFHNYFIGQSEYCTANSSGTAYIERGNSGAMIVNLGGTTTKSVTLTNHKLTAGTYKDAITGNTFTVTSSQIKGNVGNTGVAVLYENNETPTEAPTEPPITYILGDANSDNDVQVDDATKILRYVVDLETLTDVQTLAADVDGDGFVTVIDATIIQRYMAEMPVKYDVGKEKTTSKPQPTTPYVQPTTPYVEPTTPYVEPTSSPDPVGSFLLTDNFGWGSAYVYAWDADGNELNGPWPGAAQAETIVNDLGQTQFRCYVPEGAIGVILSNGNGAQTEDITDFTTYDGYWMDGSQNELGHYKVTGWNYDPDPDPDPQPTTAPQPSGDDGIYLVGTFNSWTPSEDYKFTENSAAPGEYMLSTTLSEGDGVKVVKVSDGQQTWYPDGEGNDYIVDAAHAGAVTIYFKETYQADWAAFNGYMYIDNGSTPDPDPQPTEAPQPSGDDGIYLVGTFNSWTPSEAYKFTENSAAPGEYMLSTTLTEGDGVKVVKVSGGQQTWYPDGEGNDYIVDAAHAGAVTIYFKETYQADWAAFNGYMYIDNGSTPDPDPQPTEAPQPSGEDGFYLVGSFSNWEAQSGYKFTENSAAPGEYMLSTTLSETDGVKVVKVENGVITTWYPDGEGNDYTVDAAHAGAVTIYFKETYQADWAAFNGYMYIDNGSTPTPDPDPTTPYVEPTQPVVEPDGRTIIFSNNKSFSTVNIYYWSDEDKPVEWPGVPMTYYDTNEVGEQRFSFEMPAGMTYYIINDGTLQTVDITFTGSTGVYMTDKDSNGKYAVAFYEISGTDPTPTPQPTTAPEPSANTLTLVPGVWNQGVERMAAYFFGNGETWVDMTKSGDNYTVEVPDGYTSVIFCRMNGATSENNWNNKWNQTSDLTIPSGGGTYTITGWGESDGHW